MEKSCFFCDVQNQTDSRKISERATCFARYDDFPVNRGHAEIMPKRHVAFVFELTHAEWSDIEELLGEVKEELDTKYKPDGYTIGANVGTAAGQTIPHVHIHVIPRYNGDVQNPKGGIRNILTNGDYSEAAKAAGKEKYL